MIRITAYVFLCLPVTGVFLLGYRYATSNMRPLWFIAAGGFLALVIFWLVRAVELSKEIEKQIRQGGTNG